jgi:hypothetical protein
MFLQAPPGGRRDGLPGFAIEMARVGGNVLVLENGAKAVAGNFAVVVGCNQTILVTIP